MTIAQCIHWLGGDWVALTCFWTNAKQHLVTQHSATPNPFTWRHTIKQKTGCCIFFFQKNASCQICILRHFCKIAIEIQQVCRRVQFHDGTTIENQDPETLKRQLIITEFTNYKWMMDLVKKKKVRCCVGGEVRREIDVSRVNPSPRAEMKGELSKQQLSSWVGMCPSWTRLF